jgi:hypothetical protein
MPIFLTHGALEDKKIHVPGAMCSIYIETCHSQTPNCCDSELWESTTQQSELLSRKLFFFYKTIKLTGDSILASSWLIMSEAIPIQIPKGFTIEKQIV